MKNQNKPWLDENNEPLSIEALKLASENWSKEIWEEYLVTLEIGVEGIQLSSSREFQDRCEDLTSSIFDLSSDHSPDELVELINNAKDKLSPTQRIVIEKYFNEGRSEREVAKELSISRSTVKLRKKDALKRIKSNLAEGAPNLTFMKGQENPNEDIFDQIEDHY